MAAASSVGGALVGVGAGPGSVPGPKPSPVDVLGGVLDYSSLGAAVASLPPTAGGTVKIGKVSTSSSSGISSGSSGFDMGRHPISTHSSSSSNNSSYGGRLQFFKGKFKINSHFLPYDNKTNVEMSRPHLDGKFILELARSKDGDKSGWVSVTRKTFRPPSAATSATVTPTSAVATAYPKNENSTSLSCKYCLEKPLIISSTLQSDCLLEL